MNLKVKIALLTSLSVIIPALLIALVSVYSINQNFKRDIEKFRSDSLKQAKLETKAKVDIAYNLVAREYERSQFKAFIEQNYGKRIQNVVESGVSILSHYYQLSQNGSLTVEEAQTAAKEDLRAFRYDEGKNYLFVLDTTYPYPDTLVHGLSRKYENPDVTKHPRWNTANGTSKNLFTVTLDALRDDESVFVTYLGPKAGTDDLVLKLSYMGVFRPWNWIVGTGVYIDEVQREFVNNLKNTLSAMRYDEGVGYYWINDTGQPYPNMVMHPIFPELDGYELNDPKWNSAKNGSKNLFVEFVDVSLAKGEGYVDYMWPKPMPNGITEDQPKISYVRYFEPLDWIIGTGIYVDYIEEQVAQKKVELDKTLRKMLWRILGIGLVVLVLGMLVAVFFGQRLSGAIAKLTDVAREISLGKGLDEKIEATSRTDEVGQLARAVERLQTSVKIMMKRMQKK